VTVTNCTIAANNDDWYFTTGVGRTDGTTLLQSQYNNAFFPSTQQQSFGDIDTSVLPTTDVISSAVLWFYIDSFTATRRITKTYRVWMLKADESAYNLIDSSTFSAAGWHTVTLTAAEIAEIDLGAGQKTLFRFTHEDPGGTNFRFMKIRAIEGGALDKMKLVVTHAPADTTFVPQITIL